MTLKEKILNEIKKAEKAHKETNKIFEGYRKGHITEKELHELINEEIIFFEIETITIPNKDYNDLFIKTSEYIKEDWKFLHFNFYIGIGNRIEVDEAVIQKEVPKSIKSLQDIKLIFITKFLKKELKDNFIYIECSVLEEFLNNKIDEESFIKIIKMQCDLGE